MVSTECTLCILKMVINIPIVKYKTIDQQWDKIPNTVKTKDWICRFSERQIDVWKAMSDQMKKKDRERV